MKRRKGTTRAVVGLLALIVIGVVVFAASDVMSPRGYALYSTPIQVKGQVVDAATGVPVVGATVYVLGGGALDAAERDLHALLEHAAEYPEASGNYGPFGAILKTGDAGTFDVTLMLSHCCAFGPDVERTFPPARDGARMLLVERKGYARTFFPTEEGTWTQLEQHEYGDPYGLVDVQVLRLPPAE